MGRRKKCQSREAPDGDPWVQLLKDLLQVAVALRCARWRRRRLLPSRSKAYFAVGEAEEWALHIGSMRNCVPECEETCPRASGFTEIEACRELT